MATVHQIQAPADQAEGVFTPADFIHALARMMDRNTRNMVELQAFTKRHLKPYEPKRQSMDPQSLVSEVTETLRKKVARSKKCQAALADLSGNMPLPAAAKQPANGDFRLAEIPVPPIPVVAAAVVAGLAVAALVAWWMSTP